MSDWPFVAWLVLMGSLVGLIAAITMAVKKHRKPAGYVEDNISAARRRAAMRKNTNVEIPPPPSQPSPPSPSPPAPAPAPAPSPPSQPLQPSTPVQLPPAAPPVPPSQPSTPVQLPPAAPPVPPSQPSTPVQLPPPQAPPSPLGRTAAAKTALQDHHRLVAKLKQSSVIQDGASSQMPAGFKPVATVRTTEGSTITVSLRTTELQRHPAPQVIDKDAWEGQYMEDYAPGLVERKLDGVNLNIKFVDREGNATQRDITVKRYAHNPATHGGVIYAFCHLRQGNRPFALGRIRQAIDLETGEVISDVGVFLDAAYQKTPSYAVEKFLEDHDAAIFVLFSFAKADGAMRVKERTIIKQWAVQHGLTQEQDVLALESQFKDWYFTKHSFYDVVKTVKKQNHQASYMQALWEASQAIVASDKTPHPDELQLLSYAARQWGIKLPKD